MASLTNEVDCDFANDSGLGAVLNREQRLGEKRGLKFLARMVRSEIESLQQEIKQNENIT